MRKFLVVAASFLAGFTACRLTRPAPEPPDLAGPAALLRVTDPAAQPVRLTVHRVVLDGRGETVRPPASSDTWRIDLAGGRVVLFAAATPE